jgi:hypothetical protein
MARYIGPNPFQRRRVFNFSRILYGVRSSVVHGEGAQAISKSLTRASPGSAGRYGFQGLAECANAGEIWVRASIRKAVLHGKPNLDALDLEAVAEGFDDENPSAEIH